VNLAEELVSMVVAQRAYEIMTRSITASDDMLQRLGQM
jgi:flagellar basal-body rod protein FlgG